MISREVAREFIDSKEKIILKKDSFNLFSEKYKSLGLIISKLINPTLNYHFNYKDPYVKTFGNDVLLNPWDSKEGLRLAEVLFGSIRAPYIKDMWELINHLPYQHDYGRRAFRRKPDIAFVSFKIQILQELCSNGTLSGFGSMTFREQIQYSVYWQNRAYAYLFAVVLEKEEEKLDELISDIINAEDEIGGISSALIKALLLTSKPKYWEQIGKLLLAAQRQEGLRQSILECLDETQIGALKYMINLVLEHDLSRFSSVVRAVDVWYGFGWEAPKKATIKRALQLTSHLLENNNEIDKHLASKDYLEVYIALCVIAFKDADEANRKAFDILFNHPKKPYKLLALFFVHQTKRTSKNLIPYFEKELGNDIELDYWMSLNMPKYELSDAIFEKIKTIADSLPAKGKSFSEVVFSWSNYTIEPNYFYRTLIEKASQKQLENIGKNISAIASTSRESFMRKIFPNHYTYSWYAGNKHNDKHIKTTSLGWKRSVIHQAVVDRNQSVMATGLRLFQTMDLHDEELNILQNVLERKNKHLRKASIQLIVKQPEAVVKEQTNQLIASKKISQRLAGLEVLTILDDRKLYLEYVTQQVDQYLMRDSFHKNEEVFLEKFNTSSTQYTLSNGFGAIDYDNLSPLYIPKEKFKKKKGILNSLLGRKEILISRFIDAPKTIKAVNKLIDLYKANANFEYQYTGYKEEMETTLLSKNITSILSAEAQKEASGQELLESLPLSHLWMNWYEGSKLNDYELDAATYYFNNNYNDPHGNAKDLIPFFKNYFPDLSKIDIDKNYHYNSYNRNIHSILYRLCNAYIDNDTLASFKLDLLEDAIVKFPEEFKNKNLNAHKWRNNDQFWPDVISHMTNFQFNAQLNFELKKRAWDIKRYLSAQSIAHPRSATSMKEALSRPMKHFGFIRNSELDTIKLYQQKLVNKDDVLLDSLFGSDSNFALDSQYSNNRRYKDLDLPFEIFQPLKRNLLETELQRGEIETDATRFVKQLSFVEGAKYTVEALERLGKIEFERGYSYNSSGKRTIFSSIIKKSIPSPEDTFEGFSILVKEAKISKKKLIELACYATQWADWVGRYLKLDDLQSAVWWFHAHSQGYYRNPERETMISRYSDVSVDHFNRGAIDIDWFYSVYKKLGKANWKILHEASKFITDGMGHKQIKLYSSVLLGEVKITETLKRIKEKRSKDYVRALGLIPLSKTRPEADLLKRYNLLQTFLKQSKQFGAQRQASEKNAVEIGLENLSRNAGYRDSMRFSWAMEAKSVQKIMENAKVTLDDLEVTLFVNTDGKADLKIQKNGKAQKAIPKKHQKNKEIIRLKSDKSYLAKQFSRTRLSLETAMVNEDAFAKTELENIMRHPVVTPMLSKLVLYSKEKEIAGFLNDGYLINPQGEKQKISDEDELVIAHPTHLYHAVQWDVYQRYLFDEQIKQPFKQVYRELYIITDDERENSTRSHRYQGHQIQPKKTIALLRSRGWTLNYEEGLQKVYHKEGLMVSMYAMADWYSPSDIEATTLEFVAFTSLKDYKVIPLSEINPLIFSEVMRDVDLVVSVAHAGGVDPEASHSTMEMRAVLARESARLFKLDNVEVKKRHIIVKGNLGEYSIHLGSANVSKGSLAMSIIPVHSQHRGRVFLPFVDDDPKSAEIISKMKLLAEDNKIQDPTILAQINK